MTISRTRINYLGLLATIAVVVGFAYFLPKNGFQQDREVGSLETIEGAPAASEASSIKVIARTNAPIEARGNLKAIDLWEGGQVLISKRINRNVDGSRYALRRIVAHPDVRYPILVEEIVRKAPLSLQIESREIVSEKAAAHFLLTPKNSVSEEILRDTISGHGLQLGERVSASGPYRILIPESLLTVESVSAMVSDFNSGAYSNIVAYADYDYVRRIAAAPNDVYYSSGDQWGLENDGSRRGSVKGIDIGAIEGWEVRTDAANIVVAIVDTGARYTHEDLQENIWINSDEVSDNGLDDDGNGYVDDLHGINALFSPDLAIGGDPLDDHGHGTHVAGTIGAKGNNNIGIAGVAWDVQLMPLKFLGPNGNGMDSDAIKCIDYAISNGADIINNSWGGAGVNRALSDAVERAHNAGVIFVVAAGNGGDDIDVDAYTPAGIDLPNVVTVANHNDSGYLQASSNFGREKVDLAAPGTRIRSATFGSDSSYGFKTGTSMAAPHVAGVLALLKAEYPSENHIKLIERVLQGTVPSTQFDGKIRTDARLNMASSFAITQFVPPSPSNTKLSTSSGYASLTWEHDWNDPISGFRIEKRMGEGSWKIAGFVGPEGRQFADPALHHSSSAEYRLVSVNVQGASLPSQRRALNTVVGAGNTVDIELPSGDDGIGYGSAVDATRNVLVVGAPQDDDAGEGSGSVYLYERIMGSGWEYRQKLIGSDGEEFDNFGHSVSLDDSLLAVGAYNEDETSIDGGAVYLFEPDQSGFWIQTKKLLAPDGQSLDRFGFSVDVHGDRLVASARDDDDSGQNAGSVYVFERDSAGEWRYESKLTPPLGSAGQYFGWSVSTYGERIVVGAKGDDSAGIGTGSVYVYRGTGSNWILEQKIVPEDSSNYDAFGSSLDFDGESIVIGTPNDDGAEFDIGSVSLYQYSGAQWERLKVFFPTESASGEHFGSDVSVSGKRIAAIGQKDDGTDGYGQVFEERGPGDWIEGTELFLLESTALRGSSITLSDQVVSVGNPSERRLRSVYDIPDTPIDARIASESKEGVSLVWTEVGREANSIAIERRELGEEQWRLIGTAQPSQNGFIDPSAIGGRQWEYRVSAVSGGISNASNAATTSVLPRGRLVNLSVRGFVGEGERVLVPGFTVVGSDGLSVALRARGPSLLEHGVPDPILDPKMTVYPLGQDSLGANDDWFLDYTVDEMEAVERETGASPIALYASESVYLGGLSTGVYTAVIEDSESNQGLGLAEIFEVPTDGEYSDDAALVNLSARGYVDTGANVLIGGFVIAGDAPVQVLIRGVGPSLADYGVVDVLDRPRVTVYDVLGSPIVSNANWGLGGQIAEIIELSSEVGAFDLAFGSLDSGLIVTLPPGLYTCILDTDSEDKGVGLLEIYLAP